MKHKSDTKGKEKHKHDFQLLSYGNKTGYWQTLTDMVVLMACRNCGRVFEETVKSLKNK